MNLVTLAVTVDVESGESISPMFRSQKKLTAQQFFALAQMVQVLAMNLTNQALEEAGVGRDEEAESEAGEVPGDSSSDGEPQTSA